MIIPKLIELKYKNIKHYLKHNYPDFLSYIENNYKELPIQQGVYWYYHNIKDHPTCKECNNKVKFISLSRGYATFCSKRCKCQSKEVSEKTKKTNLERYGVENVFQSDEFQNKARNTQIKKYGGVGSASEIIKKKVISTNLKKYGVTCTLHNKQISEKTKKTNLERYGVENVFQSKEIQSIAKENQFKKYGGIGWGSDQILQKTLNTYKNKFLHNHPDILDVQYSGNGQRNTMYTCSCNMNCNKCKEKTFNIDSMHYWTRKNSNPDQLCTKLYPITVKKEKDTIIEAFIQNILNKYNIEFIRNDRSILTGTELDIYIPKYNIGIECNGIFWHSTYMKHKKYHIDKYNMCKEKNISLISIWEDWIMSYPDIVKSIILSKLNIYNNIWSSTECAVDEINKSDCRDFLKNNCIYGDSISSVRYGLYYKDQIVSVMTFRHISDKKWQLCRFCESKYIKINGGFAKLFNWFIKNNDVDDIIYHVSCDIPQDSIYDLGFEKEHKLSCWYIDQKNYHRYSEYEFKKHYPNCNLTEKDICNLGYFRIYDTGYIKVCIKKDPTFSRVQKENI